MNETATRRALIQSTLAAGVLAGLPLATSAGDSTATLWDEFPRQDAKLVAEVVGAAHANEVRVKELVQAHPAGVPSVRFRFAVENGKASELTIKGTDLHIIAKRNAG